MLDNSKAVPSFSVNDLEKAKQFYGNTLGLKVSENTEMKMLNLNINDGNRIMIYPKPDHTPANFTVLNFPVSNVEKTVDELTAKGVKFEQYPSFGTNAKGIVDDPRGPKIAWFKDPAGNVLSVLEER
jgi:catechol 2,3-dioxygenase-like lactoylglutathione lyase family enzyme